MAAIGADCSRRFRAVHNSGRRDVKAIRWLVVHDTEGDTAEGAASWFQNAASGGSTQIVVDDNDCFRTLENNEIPWAAYRANEQGWHVEIAGYAHWTRDEWLRHDLRLRRAAFKVAWHARLFGVPIRWVGPWSLKLGRKGITTHADVWNAFPNLDRHTDPGPGFPKDVFLQYVKDYAGQIGSL